MNMKNFNMEEILNKAKEMQGQFQKMQEAFSQKNIVGMAGIDDDEQIYVKATIDGMRMLKHLEIGKGAQAESAKVLADLIIGAVNNATEKLNGDMQSEVKKIYEEPGLNLGDSSTDKD